MRPAGRLALCLDIDGSRPFVAAPGLGPRARDAVLTYDSGTWWPRRAEGSGMKDGFKVFDSDMHQLEAVDLWDNCARLYGFEAP